MLEGPAPAQATSPEKPEDTRKRIEQWHKEAREILAKLDSTADTAILPSGISHAQFNEYRRDLEQLLLTTSTSLKEFSAVEQATKALERASAEEAAWTGFKEKPPFSILLLDDLLNERSAVLVKRRTTESSLANIQSLLATAISELKNAESRANLATAAVQNGGDDKLEVAKWELDAARVKVRVLAARAGYLQSAIEVQKQRVAAVHRELALVDRKIATVRTAVVFSDEDLKKIEENTNGRIKDLAKEIAAASKRLQTAMTASAKEQAALDAILSRPPEENSQAAIDLARLRVETAIGRVESLQSVNQSLEGLSMMENLIMQAYQDRRAIEQTKDKEEREKLVTSLSVLAERYRTWIDVIRNEIATGNAELSKIESRSAPIPADDPRAELINEQRAATSEMLTLLHRVQQSASSHRALLKRWLADYSQSDQRNGPLEKIAAHAADGWKMLKKTWDFEVMSFEDTVEVDGQMITGAKLPVTVGMLVRALLFFVIGYGIAAKIANHIQGVVITRGHVAEAQAKTLRNWVMIVVGVGLALGTLSFLNIPLTVFAFFGGALAIGLGFGMQTLIKNFISGIIVLAERKVRVGDILDVDGIIGTVVEVNTRSSIIRSADEVETMIPNSVFLENRVTNWTLTNSRMRRNIRVGVAYGSDPRVVMNVLTECAVRHGQVCKEPSPFATFDDFGDSALVFTLYFWIEFVKGTNPIVVASDLRLMIDKRFAELDISVPFIQRDIHLISKDPIHVKMTP